VVEILSRAEKVNLEEVVPEELVITAEELAETGRTLGNPVHLDAPLYASESHATEIVPGCRTEDEVIVRVQTLWRTIMKWILQKLKWYFQRISRGQQEPRMSMGRR
jgi:hypothetical protein